MGGNGGMRAAARRDPEFRGIDPDALGELIKRVQDASAAITGWLNTHRPPPGVPSGGYHQAAQVEQWASEQLGMLARRRNYAITHPDRGEGVTPPARRTRTHAAPGGARDTSGTRARAPGTGHGTGGGDTGTAGGRGGVPGGTTPAGAGADLGSYPTRQAAARAARADAAAFEHAADAHGKAPAGTWERLGADAGDPDYTEAFYARLGPAGTAGLIAMALREGSGDARSARIDAMAESLGTAGRHVPMSEKWLRELLTAAERNGDRAEAVRILDAAGLSARAGR